MSRTAWLPTIAWAGVILALTSWPRPPSFGLPPNSDKVAHVALYAVFGTLLSRSFRLTRAWPPSRVALSAISVGLLFGGLDELHQQWIPGRSTSFADWLADAFGVVTSALFLLLAAQQRREPVQ
ncbi:MAG: VanZ family protein [Gemmatimonadaceae bacterium]|nr:VanZ family protein [Gemmatimonadaceae bacterium]